MKEHELPHWKEKPMRDFEKRDPLGAAKQKALEYMAHKTSHDWIQKNLIDRPKDNK